MMRLGVSCDKTRLACFFNQRFLVGFFLHRMYDADQNGSMSFEGANVLCVI